MKPNETVSVHTGRLSRVTVSVSCLRHGVRHSLIIFFAPSGRGITSAAARDSPPTAAPAPPTGGCILTNSFRSSTRISRVPTGLLLHQAGISLSCLQNEEGEKEKEE